MSSTLRITSLSIALATGALISCATESDPGARLWRKNRGVPRRRRHRPHPLRPGRPFADLTDGRWKHGSDRASVRRLVADGDPASTMPPFDGRLAPAEIDTVVDHALKLATPAPAGARP
jgi:hypothetical protein